MSRLNGVTQAGNGRIISDTMAYDKVLNPGIKTHNYLGKIFAEIFGTGTVTVHINDKKYYLNRGSCYNLLNLNHIDHTHKKKDFLPKIQTLFDKMHVNDLFQPNDDSSSESLSKHDLSNQKSKDKSVDSKTSESSETHTIDSTEDSTESESSVDVDTMRATIASLTKRLDDLLNLSYEKFAERTIQSLIISGVDQKTAEEAVEDWGQSEYQSRIEGLKNEISQMQNDLINKLAATSSQSDDSSSSESLIETQKTQPKTDPVKEVEPTISEEPNPIQSMKDDLALWKKELADLENCSLDDFIQQEIDNLISTTDFDQKLAKEAAEATGEMQYEFKINMLKLKISTAENTLNTLSL